MARPLHRTATFLGLLALHIYGLATAIFQALNVGVTYDEPTFWGWGTRYLTERDPFQFIDHPPFAMWWGALLPKLLQSTDPAHFRLPHSGLFFVLSLGSSLLIWRRAGALASFVFAALVNFDPYVKAMAGLHVTDSDATWFLAAFALCLYSFWLEPDRRRWLILAASFYGLALSTKISMLFYAPLLALFAFYDWRAMKSSGWRTYVFFGATTALAAFAAYLGNWRFLGALKASLGFSMAHNRDGHITSLLGTYSTTGYWFYYLVLFLAKSPLATLATTVLGAKQIVWNRELKRGETWIFLLPGLFLLFLLSRAQAQVGYRYFMPGLVLLYIGIALALGRGWSASPTSTRRTILAVIFAAAALNDYWILRSDSYLTSFNPLTPKPYRNFTEANVDWHQGVPKHLDHLFRGTRSTHDLYDFLLDPNEQETEFRVGASELVYFWGSNLGMQMRAFEPAWRRAGHEVFRVSKTDLFRLFTARAPALPYIWKNDDLHSASFPAAKDAGFSKALCPENQRALIRSTRILTADSAPTPDAAGTTLSAEFDFPAAQEAVAIFRNPLGGQLWLHGVPVVDRWNASVAFVDSDYWIRLRPTGGKVKWQLVLPKPPSTSPVWNGAILWLECVSS